MAFAEMVIWKGPGRREAFGWRVDVGWRERRSGGLAVVVVEDIW